MTDDELDLSLATLPERDVDPWRAEHVRLRVRRELGPARERHHRLESAALFVVCAAQLVWAFQEAASILLH